MRQESALYIMHETREQQVAQDKRPESVHKRTLFLMRIAELGFGKITKFGQCYELGNCLQVNIFFK